jgi:hypothetical protein
VTDQEILREHDHHHRRDCMSMITTEDGTEIFYKDWGSGQLPIADSALLSAKLVKNGTLNIYPGWPHGICTIHADRINRDLLAFVKGEAIAVTGPRQREIA